MSNTVVRMRELIQAVSDMKDEVLSSGDTVMVSGNELSSLIESVSMQMEEINDIIALQNGEVTECNGQMEELSVQIKNVSSSIFNTIEDITNSRKMIDDGMETVDEMARQSRQTADATRKFVVWRTIRQGLRRRYRRSSRKFRYIPIARFRRWKRRKASPRDRWRVRSTRLRRSIR